MYVKQSWQGLFKIRVKLPEFTEFMNFKRTLSTELGSLVVMKRAWFIGLPLSGSSCRQASWPQVIGKISGRFRQDQ